MIMKTGTRMQLNHFTVSSSSYGFKLDQAKKWKAFQGDSEK